MTDVDIHLDEAAITQLLTGRGGVVHDHVTDITTRTLMLARGTVPTDTGQLKSSGHDEVRVETDDVLIGEVIFDARHALWVERGTGLFGPARRYITPVRAKFLVFRPKGLARPVFARRVKGMRATHFLLRAFRAASPYPVSETDD